MRVDYNALGQAIDNTWGRSSTPKTASYSVKMTLGGENKLHVSYAAVVSFGSERQMIDTKRVYASEADSVIAGTVKNVRDTYKDLTGLSLKLKANEDTTTDSVEIINMNVHNARRTAYYRRKMTFEVG